MGHDNINELNSHFSEKGGILAVSSYFPEGRMTVSEIAAKFNFQEGDLIDRMGLKEKPVATLPHEHPSYFATKALHNALKALGASPSEIGLIVSIGVSKDFVPPWSLALEVIKSLNCKNAIGFDLSLGCASALLGLQYAKSFRNPRAPLRVLVAAERWSDSFSPKVPFPMVLTGHSDGGTACIVGDDSQAVLGDLTYIVQAQFNDFILIPGGGSVNPVSQHVLDNNLQYRKKSATDVKELRYVENYLNLIRSHLKDSNQFHDKFEMLISNQIPLWMRKEVWKELKLNPRKVINTFEQYGHAGACDLFLGIELAIKKQLLSSGDSLMVTSTPSVFSAMPLKVKTPGGGIQISS